MKNPLRILTIGLIFLLPTGGSLAQDESDDYDREGNLETTMRFIREGQMEEDLSREHAVTYRPQIPTAIVWCVKEDLGGKHDKDTVDVLAVAREPSGRWAVAISKAGKEIYYTSMIKPRDNIKILGSSTRLEEALSLVPEEGRAGLKSVLENSYSEETARRSGGGQNKSE